MTQEEAYVKYRMYSEVKGSLKGLFKNDREVLIVYEDGEKEELDMRVMHLDSLRERFPDVDDGIMETEYAFSCELTFLGYIVFIIDNFSISIFLPKMISSWQKETVVEILRKLNDIDPEYLVYAGIVMDDRELTAIGDAKGNFPLVLVDALDVIPIKNKDAGRK